MVKQEHMPMVSIIVPVYNKAKYIDEVLKSVSVQTFRDFECLLIDDGSTDGSSTVCQKQCRNDERFKYHRTCNKGVSHARNIGLKHSVGKYITFVDADDKISITYLEELLSTVTLHQSDIAISGLVKMDEQGTEREFIKYPFEEKNNFINDILPSFGKLQEEYGVLGWCWGKLVKREVVNNVYFDERISLAEDLDFYIRVYPNINSVSYCKKAIYYYRLQAENSSVMVNDEDIDYFTQLIICDRIKRFFVAMNAYSSNNKEYIDRKIQNYIYYWLFHSNSDNFEKRYIDVRNYISNTNPPLVRCHGFQKVILKNTYSGNKETVRALLLLYGFLRKTFRR